MVTHRFKLDQIEEAYELFANQRGGVFESGDYALEAAYGTHITYAGVSC